MLPRTSMRPIDLADIFVLIAGIIKLVIRHDYSTANDCTSSFFGKDNITGFDFICELPRRMSSHCIWSFRINMLFHGLFHFCLGGILIQVANLIPANCHDSILDTLIPNSGTFTG